MKKIHAITIALGLLSAFSLSIKVANAEFLRPLKIGDVGADVRDLQRLLNADGVTVAQSGPGSSGKETDRFGSATEDAVRKFQCKYAITCAGTREDGYGRVGPRTLRALTGASFLRPRVSGATTDGLIAHWTFDDGGSGTTAVDSAGSNRATLANGTTWVEGKIGSGSLRFDGTDDHVNTGIFASLGSDTTKTISAWVNPSGSATGFVFAVPRTFGATAGFGFLIENGKWGGRYWTSTSAALGSAADVAAGQWALVTLVQSGASVSLYINGASVATASNAGTFDSSSRAAYIGALNNNNVPSYPFSGKVDDVRVYDRDLSAGEIAEMYAVGNVMVTNSEKDSIAPSMPSNLSAAALSGTEIDLNWTASTDNVGVVGYKLLRNDVLIADVVGKSSFSDAGLSPNVLYSYKVSAYDAAGNSSASGNVASIKTLTGNRVDLKNSSGMLLATFSTIQACVDAAMAGNTCLAHSGDYDEVIATKTHGTPSLPITIKAENPAIVAGSQGIDISPTRLPTSIIRNAVITHDYVTLEGFEIIGKGGGYQNGIDVMTQASYGKILNNYVHDLPINGGGIGFAYQYGVPYTSDNFLVKNNYIKNIRYGALVGINGRGHVIENNKLEQANGTDAMRLNGKDHVIRKNYFVNISSVASNGNHTDIIQTFGNNDFVAHDVLFEENFIYNSDAQIGNFTQDGVSDIRDWTFRGNVFVNVGGQANIFAPGFKFVNNTFFNVKPTSIVLIYRAVVTGGKKSSADRGVVRNNLFVDSGVDLRNSLYASEPALIGFAADHNFITGTPPAYKAKSNWSDAVNEPSLINGGDPKFMNYSSPLGNDGIPFTADDGLMLQAGSRALGAGEGGLDIGAYQFGGNRSAGSVIVPPAPVADSDADGILDRDDLCPNTSLGMKPKINGRGCVKPIVDGFDFGPDTEQDIREVQNLQFTKNGIGGVRFEEKVVLVRNNSQIDVTRSLRIEKNKVALDSLAIPELNKKAEITHEGVTFLFPKILRDGVPCPATVCSIKSFANGILVYSVTGFSTYEIVEGDEGSFAVPATPVVQPSTGGGGYSGGGGGSYTIIYGNGSASADASSAPAAGCQPGAAFSTLTGQRCPAASASSAASSGAPAYAFARSLTVGARGDDVRALQRFLNASGFAVAQSGPGSAGNETLSFGPATRAALARYQAAKGIRPAAGFFGPATRASVSGSAPAPASSAAPASAAPAASMAPASSGATLRLGSSGPAVKVLRQKLRAAGYLAPYGSASDVPASAALETSSFGATTESALRKFQCEKGIACSGSGWGIAGPATRAALGL